jgi:uncharacterized protein with NRDE domain
MHNSFADQEAADMCLLIFAHRADPRYPLVLAANRDEFHSRPTEPSRFWPEHPQLLAGRDLEQGGTWMGITRTGRFAAITNYRDPARTAPAPHSRGELPLNYLCGDQDPEAFLQDLQPRADDYAGFNLLLGTPGDLWYFTNSVPTDKRRPSCLAPGLYGLSNAQLNTPWPKVTRGTAQLKAIMGQEPPGHAGLAGIVGSRELAELSALHEQGLNGEMDQLLSAQFITSARYGTRSTTSLWIDHNGGAHWRELSFNSNGVTVAEREESFSIA